MKAALVRAKQEAYCVICGKSWPLSPGFYPPDRPITVAGCCQACNAKRDAEQTNGR